jgi:hypothetical protein
MSLCSMLTCNSKSDALANIVTQNGQLNLLSRAEIDSGGRDGDVRSKCWRLICSCNLNGQSEL